MTNKSPSPSQRPRWQSLVGTAFVLLVAVIVYLRTGAVPDELLDGVLGTATTSAIAQQTDTPIPSDTPVDTDTPTATEAAEPTATSTSLSTETPTGTPTETPTGTPTSAPTATQAATEPPTETPTATHTSTATQQPTATATASPTRTRAPPTATPTPTPTATRIRSQSGLPWILYDDLPPEAKETVQLIDNNGPFPFRQDDTTFQNRERILPLKPRDWYREFTVITPGLNHRGARRIVEGEDGTLFYTDDHYDSFREVIR